MKLWQRCLGQLLANSEAPPALTRDLIDRFARSAQDGRTVPASTLSLWIRREAEDGNLLAVQRGLYLNHFRAIPGTLADTVPLLHKDAVVSLNTVLGDAGLDLDRNRINTNVGTCWRLRYKGVHPSQA